MCETLLNTSFLQMRKNKIGNGQNCCLKYRCIIVLSCFVKNEIVSYHMMLQYLAFDVR